MTRSSLMIATLLVSSTVLAGGDYVDVHVHIRGTTSSGMLGNMKGQEKPGGLRMQQPNMRPFTPPKKRRRQPEKTRPSGGSRSGSRMKQGDQSENLEKAAAMMIRKMDDAGIKYALAVVVPGPVSSEQEYTSLRKVADAHSDRIKLMAGGAMLSTYLQEMPPEEVRSSDRAEFKKIAERILRDGAVGFGEMISCHLSMADHHSFQFAPADHPLFLELADIAAENDVPIDLHMEAITADKETPANIRKASSKNPKTLEATIPPLERLLKHNRKARIVWQHIGWDNTGEMTPALISRLLGDHPNLYIALRVENRLDQVGGGGEMPNRLVDKKGRLTDEWLKVIEAHKDRAVIGSDEFFFPVETSTPRPNQSFDGTWKILEQLPPHTASMIGGSNAMRIYKLD